MLQLLLLLLLLLHRRRYVDSGKSGTRGDLIEAGALRLSRHASRLVRGDGGSQGHQGNRAARSSEDLQPNRASSVLRSSHPRL